MPPWSSDSAPAAIASAAMLDSRIDTLFMFILPGFSDEAFAAREVTDGVRD